MEISPLAGKPADPASLVNVPELVTAYYTEPLILRYLRASHPHRRLDGDGGEWMVRGAPILEEAQTIVSDTLAESTP